MLFSVVPTEYQLKEMEFYFRENNYGTKNCHKYRTDTKYIKGYGAIWDPGLGKTKMMLDVAQNLFIRNEIELVVIVVPSAAIALKTEYEEVPKEFGSTIIDRTSCLSIFAETVGKKSFTKTFDSFTQFKGLKVVTVTYRTLITKHDHYVHKLLDKFPNNLVCLDESHNIKDPSTLQTRSCLKLAPKAKYRIIATGTPVTKAPTDYYTQVDFLYPKFWQLNGYASWFAFRNDYQITTELTLRKGGIVTTIRKPTNEFKNLDKMRDFISWFCHRLEKKAVAKDLPPKQYLQHYYMMSPNQIDLYKQMATKGAFLFKSGAFEDQTAIAKLAFHKVIQCHQILANSFTATDELGNPSGRVRIDLTDPRMEALLELLNGVYEDKQVVIWSDSVWCIDRIMETLGTKAVRYDGSVDVIARENNKKQFIDGLAQYFVGNVSMGIGFNLINADVVIYYSNSYKMVDRVQSEDRCHRIGQKSSTVTIIDLIGVYMQNGKICHTADKKLLDNLKDKLMLAKTINNDEAQQWL